VTSARTASGIIGDHGYPRPQLVREQWESLNGAWRFAFDDDERWAVPADVQWQRDIMVPFAPETDASGVRDRGFHRACWYQRGVTPPRMAPTDRLIIHFGAVDNIADVWVNGEHVAHHVGGYTPFSVDVTRVLRAMRQPQLIVTVRAFDDPTDLAVPRGKQDWQLEPHSIWYPRTTGIWQTVWMERVPAAYLANIRFTPSLARWEIGVEASFAGDRRDDLSLELVLAHNGNVLAEDRYRVVAGEINRRIALSDPGIDDSRNELLWSPSSPRLIDVTAVLRAGGDVVDIVRGYCALRSIRAEGDRITLNGRPLSFELVLDQGLWPQTGLTPPSDQALRRDVELAKAMGFNGVRKHQKIEDPRYLYWADALGLLVWEEMPSAYRYTRKSISRVCAEWRDVLERDYSHPCIVTWVPFNESWGVPNLPDSQAERHYVQALYHLTKSLDTTRLVVGNDGWEAVATDVIGVHDYDDSPERIAHRYQADHLKPRLLKKERPGGRELLIGDHHVHADHPMVLSEFGGIALAERGTWGYSTCKSPDDLAERYAALLEVVRDSPLLCGFCYTQFADTYQEANGLLFADRRPKFAIERIARATRGK
jgi:beta-galactosidase/beta-glucuronidase